MDWLGWEYRRKAERRPERDAAELAATKARALADVSAILDKDPALRELNPPTSPPASRASFAISPRLAKRTRTSETWLT